MPWYTYSATLQSGVIASCANIIQLKSTGAPFEILRAWVSQSASVTSATVPIQICRKTAAGDVAPFTPLHVGSTNDPVSSMVASSSGCGTFNSTSAFGTDGDIIVRDAFNVLNGWLYLPVPEERILTQGGGVIALRFPIAVTSETWEAGVIWREFR